MRSSADVGGYQTDDPTEIRALRDRCRLVCEFGHFDPEDDRSLFLAARDDEEGLVEEAGGAVDRGVYALVQLEDPEGGAEALGTDGQADEIESAAGLLKKAERVDRDLRGPTPEDKLVATVDETDECLNCGEPIDEGGWCGWECFQEWGQEAQEAES